MNLTVIENKAIAQLPVSLQEFVTAKFKPQIQALKESELEARISALVMRTLAEAGVKDANDNKVVTFIRETLLEDLRGPRFSKLTFEEIELSFKKGVRHEYGPFMGVNIQTIHFWLKSFLNSKEREIAIKEFYKKADEEEFGKSDRSGPVNPEGQKKVLEVLRSFVDNTKPNYDQKVYRAPQKSDRDIFIQQCMRDFDKLCDANPSKDVNGKQLRGRLIDHEITDVVKESSGDEVLITHIRPIDVTEYITLKVKIYDLNNLD